MLFVVDGEWTYRGVTKTELIILHTYLDGHESSKVIDYTESSTLVMEIEVTGIDQFGTFILSRRTRRERANSIRCIQNVLICIIFRLTVDIADIRWL